MRINVIAQRVWIAASIFSACVLPLVAQDYRPPELIKRVEVDYSGLPIGFVMDWVSVTMGIGPKGVPVYLSTTSSLPDNVVEALAQWRYRPGKKDGLGIPYSIDLSVPVRRPIDHRMEMDLRRTWSPKNQDLKDAILAGENLDAPGAADLERLLKSKPGDLKARSTLLAYFAKATLTPSDEIRRARAEHIAWLVTNHPEADVLGGPLSLINASDDPLADPIAYGQIKQLWLTKLASDPLNTDVLEHATNFMRVTDPAKAEELLLAAKGKRTNVNVWLGDLYALTILGVTALDIRTGIPLSAGKQLPKGGFSDKSLTELATTTDARELLSALATTIQGGWSLARAEHLPRDYAALCQDLHDRALRVYPGTSYSCDLASAPSFPLNPVEPSRIRIGGAFFPKRIKGRAPRGQGVAGLVRFKTIIGTDGKVLDLELISGPLMLYPSAREAISRWVFRPMKLNGQPVEIMGTIEINFVLDGPGTRISFEQNFEAASSTHMTSFAGRPRSGPDSPFYRQDLRDEL